MTCGAQPNDKTAGREAVREAGREPGVRGILLVTNKVDGTVGIIDPAAGVQLAAVEAGGVTPHEVVASPDGRTAFAPIYGNSGVGKPGTDGQNIAVIDIGARKVTGNIDFGHGVRPHCALFGPKDWDEPL